MSTRILIALGLILFPAGASAMLAPRMAQLATAGPQKVAQNTGGEASRHEARNPQEISQTGQSQVNAANPSRKMSEGNPGETAPEAGGDRNSRGSSARADSTGRGVEETASNTAERTVEKESLEREKTGYRETKGRVRSRRMSPESRRSPSLRPRVTRRCL